MVCLSVCVFGVGAQVFRPCSTCPWRRQWHPTPVLWPGKSHGRRSLVGCSPWNREESHTTERLHFHFSLSCIGEGNGNPLQCSCLENPRDGGAWWAAIYGVTQNRTRLKRLSSSSSSSTCPWWQGACNIGRPWIWFILGSKKSRDPETHGSECLAFAEGKMNIHTFMISGALFLSTEWPQSPIRILFRQQLKVPCFSARSANSDILFLAIWISRHLTGSPQL